jgi:hypothetical protein
MTDAGRRWSYEHVPKQRLNDGRRNVPLPQDYTAYAVSVSSESADPRLQTWERMAIRPFGSGRVDPQPNQNRRELLN